MANPNTREVASGTDATNGGNHATKPLEHNKAANQEPTSRNEPRRTPQSRHDRESHVGGSNPIQARRGGGV